VNCDRRILAEGLRYWTVRMKGVENRDKRNGKAREATRGNVDAMFVRER